ncbi:hypothetical protein CPB83DRAFT_877663 [Crepidotus variabilis]|uniref:Uncharacterized protein n=1 Tax=Crepidotus variabilis TaxID=179855 RepID=A0A9P6E891_9AGAR|nr:hypothetical protein CPB83DRAFT_877663 [Crepidotus variabilis]
MDDSFDPLEKIFQKVEEESERRAQKELEREEAAELHDKPPVSKAQREKERRRGSISISRFGKVDENSASPSPTPLTPTISTITSNSPFYQAQIANGSTTSVASGASAFSGEHAHSEDRNHVTQMQHIAGKQSISSRIIPRRLSRANSTSVMPSTLNQVESNVIIGVSVQEATEDSAHPKGDDPVPVERRASVQALGVPSLRSKASRSSLMGTKTTNTSWISKARGFTLKFRRKAAEKQVV